jgi:hypothetical protein
VNSTLASKGKHCWEFWGGIFRLGLGIEKVSAVVYVNEMYVSHYAFLT